MTDKTCKTCPAWLGAGTEADRARCAFDLQDPERAPPVFVVEYNKATKQDAATRVKPFNDGFMREKGETCARHPVRVAEYEAAVEAARAKRYRAAVEGLCSAAGLSSPYEGPEYTTTGASVLIVDWLREYTNTKVLVVTPTAEQSERLADAIEEALPKCKRKTGWHMELEGNLVLFTSYSAGSWRGHGQFDAVFLVAPSLADHDAAADAASRGQRIFRCVVP